LRGEAKGLGESGVFENGTENKTTTFKQREEDTTTAILEDEMLHVKNKGKGEYLRDQKKVGKKERSERAEQK
jgi:hypothetical protein